MNKEVNLSPPMPQTEVALPTSSAELETASNENTQLQDLESAETAERAASLLEQKIAKLQKDIANLKEILGRKHFVAAQNEYDNLQQQLADDERFKCFFTAATYASERIDADRIAMNKETFVNYDPLMMQKDNLEVERKFLEIKRNLLQNYFLHPQRQGQQEVIRASKDQVKMEILRKKAADIFEFLTYHVIEHNDVFADNLNLEGQPIEDTAVDKLEQAAAVPSALYDDLFNGVDCVFKAGGPASLSKVVAFAIDATIGVSSSNLAKKDFHLDNLEKSGELSQIKYLSLGENFPYVGELKNVPRYTVSIGDEKVLYLSQHYLVPGLVEQNEAAVSQQAHIQMEKLAAHILVQLCVESAVTYLLSNHLLHQHLDAQDLSADELQKYRQANLCSKNMWHYFSRGLTKKINQANLARRATQPTDSDSGVDGGMVGVAAYIKNLSLDVASAKLIKHYVGKIYNMAGKGIADERHPYRGIRLVDDSPQEQQYSTAEIDNQLIELVLTAGREYALHTLKVQAANSRQHRS